MHPAVMTIIAEDRALDLRAAASAHRRGRLARSRVRRVFTLRFARRVAPA